jgi:hypothetical protein
MTLSCPPQRRQHSMWMANTRLRRCAHIMRTCLASQTSIVTVRNHSRGRRDDHVAGRDPHAAFT